mgnify:CR=1 FL=1
MRASFLGLEIQKRSVQMAQKALDVTGNNLSNRDTVGYTRQRLDVYSSYMNMNGIYTTKLARLGLSSQGVFASGVSHVIEPRNTRFRIIRALQQLQTKKLTNPAKKHGNIPL